MTPDFGVALQGKVRKAEQRSERECRHAEQQ
jgi:hypothetical protein